MIGVYGPELKKSWVAVSYRLSAKEENACRHGAAGRGILFISLSLPLPVSFVFFWLTADG
jgi:hypothetical protein